MIFTGYYISWCIYPVTFLFVVQINFSIQFILSATQIVNNNQNVKKTVGIVYEKKNAKKRRKSLCVFAWVSVGCIRRIRENLLLCTLFYFALVYPYLTFICWFQQLACAAFTFIHIFICFGAPLPLHTVAALYSSYCLEFDICTWWQQHYGWIQKQ